MKSNLRNSAIILFVFLCLTACSDVENNSGEKQAESPVAETNEKADVKQDEESKKETNEVVAAVKTPDSNEQINAFLEDYYKLGKQLSEKPVDRKQIERFYEMYSWYVEMDSAGKKEWVDQQVDYLNTWEENYTETYKVVEILKDSEAAEGVDNTLVTKVILVVEEVVFGEGGSWTENSRIEMQLIPAENEYGWHIYEIYHLGSEEPVEVATDDESPIHIQTAVAGIVKEEELISYYQSAVKPQDVTVKLYNATGSTGGEVTPNQEGVVIFSETEFFGAPIRVKVGETLGIIPNEDFRKGFYYRFESLEPGKRITEILTRGQEVIGKGKFVAVVTRTDNRETFYILFEGI